MLTEKLTQNAGAELTMQPWQVGAAAAVGAGALAFYVLGWRPLLTYRLRSVPCAPGRLPFVGNLLAIIRSGDLAEWLEVQTQQLGQAFVFWQGSKPAVALTDPSLIRTLLIRLTQRPSLKVFTMLTGENHEMVVRGLLNISPDEHGSKFRSVRKAYEAVLLTPSALSHYSEWLETCAGRMTDVFAHYAASGQPVDAVGVFSNMTMDAIGYAAFGLDLQCCTLRAAQAQASGRALLEAHARRAGGGANGHAAAVVTRGGSSGGGCPFAGKGAAAGGVCPASGARAAGGGGDWFDAPIGSPEFSQGLVEACRLLFRVADFGEASVWRPLGLIFPELYDVIRHVANWLPDKRLRRELEVRRGIQGALRKMIKLWRDHKQAADAAAAAAAAALEKEGGGATPAAAAPTLASPISDKGFLARLLSSTAGGGEKLDELDVMAQCVTVLLAGYETTASALSACTHLLAQHPEAQRKAHLELDAVLGGKLPKAEDLERLPYTCAVFDEALRLWPPADTAVRTLLPMNETLHLGNGMSVPPGVMIWANIHALQRDPAVWPRPHDFIPERFLPGHDDVAPSNPQAFLPFGLGARRCVGYRFAEVEGRLALAALLQAFTIRPAEGCPAPRWKRGIVHSADQVWVSFAARARGASVPVAGADA